jgi:hypothetical protein
MKDDNWGRTEKSLNIFISSPTDVDKERSYVHDVVDDVNRTLGEKLGLFLRIKDWRKFRTTGENASDFITKQLKNCDLFIMVFSRRFGSRPSPESDYTSGTEMEYEIARDLRHHSKNNIPEIFTYFKEIEDRILLGDPGVELKKVLDFKERISKTHFYKEYNNTYIFPYVLKDHLIEWLFEVSEKLKPKDEKKEILKKFFDLGTTKESSIPSTLIIYPSSDQEIADDTHLLPYMILEDFQAIHKITKCLNIADYDHVHSCSLNLYERAREKHQNEVFLCLPRNPAGQECLDSISEKRFHIEPYYDGYKNTWKIVWKLSPDQFVEVHSPQSAYLKEQRNITKGRWKENPGNCYTVDFAVIARFNSCNDNLKNGKLKKFFIFGIRGLGTWGAAWFLDRRFEELSPLIKNESNIQLLLKVVYRDNRIRGIENVSDKEQDFFDRENNKDFIKERVSTFLKKHTHEF